MLNYSYFIPTFHRQIPTFFLVFSRNYSYFFPTFSSKATFKPVIVFYKTNITSNMYYIAQTQPISDQGLHC